MCNGKLPGLSQSPMGLDDFLENFGYKKPPEAPQAPQPPNPPLNPVGSSRGFETLGLGPFARVGVRTDGPKTSKTDRDMMLLLGRAYGCHTCGNRGEAHYVPDHQPPTCIFTGEPIPCNRPLCEDENFQYTCMNVGSRPSDYGRSQFLYPQCKRCSNLQGGTCSSLGFRKNTK